MRTYELFGVPNLTIEVRASVTLGAQAHNRTVLALTNNAGGVTVRLPSPASALGEFACRIANLSTAAVTIDSGISILNGVAGSLAPGYAMDVIATNTLTGQSHSVFGIVASAQPAAAALPAATLANPLLLTVQDAAGDQFKTTLAQLKAFLIPTAPAAVTGLAAVAATTTTITLAWIEPGAAPATRTVTQRPTGSGSFTASAGSFTALGGTVTGLSPGTAYDFQVVETNAVGSSSPATVANVATATGAGTLAASFVAQALPSTNLALQCCGQVVATGGLGAYSFAVAQPAGVSDPTYRISTTGVLAIAAASSTVATPRTDSVPVTVTDATGASVAINCSVVFSAVPVISLNQPAIFYNSQPLGFGSGIFFAAVGTGFDNSATITGVDSSGIFTAIGNNYLGNFTSAWPTPGNYSIAMTATESGNTLHQTIPIQVVNDPGPQSLVWKQQTFPLSSSRMPGTVVGVLLADGSLETTVLALSGPAAARYSINAITGVISTAAALVAGSDVLTGTATRNGQTRSITFTIPVPSGTTLPASAMTAAVSTTLVDWVANPSVARTVITPTLPSGITGTPVWTLQQNNRCPADEIYVAGSFAHGHARYEIDAATGLVTTRAQAMADTLTLSVTDGSNTCTAPFAVPVTTVPGPTVYIGQGMVAAHGAAGFEHFADFYANVVSSATSYANATVYILSNSDPLYHVNPCGTVGQGPLRYGWFGGATVIGIQGSGGPRPILCGPGGGAYGGVDESGKGLFSLMDGNFTFQNLEIRDVHANTYQGGPYPSSSYTGCGIRQNGNVWGNLTVDHCYIHDCDQGIESGDVPGSVSILSTKIENCGGVYVGGGATHGAYIARNAQLTVTGCLFDKGLNGHLLKTRAYASTISGSRFYDGELGGVSNHIDICEGGVNTVSGCVVQRGPQPQNSLMINFISDQFYPQTAASLLVQNCTFINMAPPPLGQTAIYMYGVVETTNGSYSTVTSTGNSFFGFGAAGNATGGAAYRTDPPNTQYGLPVAVLVNDGRPCAVAETGVITLAVPPALDFTDPSTGSASTHPGPMYVLYDGEGSSQNWQHYLNYEIDPGVDDIRASASVSIGTVLFTPTVRASPYSTLAPGYVNPFASGAVTWSIVAGATNYLGVSYTVAPTGRFSINGSTGALSVAATASPGTLDNVVLRAVAANGAIAQQCLAVTWIAGATPLIGVYEGNGNVPAFNAFSTYMGKVPDIAVDFTAFDSWTSFENDAGYWPGFWTGNVRNICASTPLTVNGTSLSDVAAGLHDSSFTKLINSIKAAAYTAPYIRIGWEMNYGYYPWGNLNSSNPATQTAQINAYIAAWRHVAQLFKAAIPGCRTIYCWAGDSGAQITPPFLAYPGSDVVDLIGFDGYARGPVYGSPSPSATDCEAWLNSSYQFDDLAYQSGVYGKPWCVPEFGIGDQPVNGVNCGPGDAVGAVVAQWVVAKLQTFSIGTGSGQLEWFGLWDFDAGDDNCKFSTGERPNIGAVWKAAFGA